MLKAAPRGALPSDSCLVIPCSLCVQGLSVPLTVYGGLMVVLLQEVVWQTTRVTIVVYSFVAR
jgi:hypothetical protein